MWELKGNGGMGDVCCLFRWLGAGVCLVAMGLYLFTCWGRKGDVAGYGGLVCESWWLVEWGVWGKYMFWDEVVEVLFGIKTKT